MGLKLQSIQRELSVVLLRADGLDQAKHRVPRALQPTHAWDKLWRPPQTIQMVHASGHGLHFAVLDFDVPKNTNSNVECISRMLNVVYENLGTMPFYLTIVQDNCSRECKNQKIIKWAIKMKTLGAVSCVSLLYPQKGHTHGPLDATGGQAITKCSLNSFDTPEELVGIYDNFLKSSRCDEGTKRSLLSYKCHSLASYFLWLCAMRNSNETCLGNGHLFLGWQWRPFLWKPGDEQANWEQWWDEIGLQFNNLTGPAAPHSCLEAHTQYFLFFA